MNQVTVTGHPNCLSFRESQGEFFLVQFYQNVAGNGLTAKQDLLGQWFLDLRLDQTSHRPCAQQSIKTTLGQPRARFTRKLNYNFLFTQLLVQFVNKFIDNLLNDLGV